jgi:peptidoglycan/LPS O-acetylase OafA/YrhL
MVFSTHYLPFFAALNWGWSGVDLFFVLSGFLITGILYDTRHRHHRFRVFYIRRTLRIFPLYYLVLLIAVLLYPLLHWKLHPGLGLWPLYVGNYSRFLWPHDYRIGGAPYEILSSASVSWFHLNLDHLWSLCVEEQFYLVWPLLVFLIRDRITLRNLCLAAVILTPLLRLAALHFASPQAIRLELLCHATPLRADSLLLGGLLALCLRGPEAARVLSLAKPALALLFVIAVLLEAFSFLRAGHAIDPRSALLYSPFLFTFLAAVAGAIILLAITPGSQIYRICMHPHLRALGQRSYGFYVYHLLLYSVWHALAIVLMLGHKRFAALGTAVVALFGTLLVSWISFRWFEAPILRLKSRFAA